MNKKRLLIPCLAAVPLLACSGAPEQAPGETTAKTSAALDPDQVFEPTWYKVSISKIVIDKAVEPYDAGNMVNYSSGSGAPGQGPPGTVATSPISTNPGGPQCSGDDSQIWTPDTGFVDALEFGLRVSGTNPFNGGNPQYAPCTLGPVHSGQTFEAPTPYCQGGAFGQALTGGYPWIQFSVNPGNSVVMALAVDNVEDKGNDIQPPTDPLVGVLSTGIHNFGDASQLVGALQTVLGQSDNGNQTLGNVGNLLGFVGTACSVAADIIDVASTNSCLASGLAATATSCAGGLLGPPPGTACNSDPSAPFPATGCAFSAPPLDTLRIVDPGNVDPSTGQPLDLTAERLQQLTADGPYTIEFNPSYDFTGTATYHKPTWYLVPRGSSSPVYLAGCASSMRIDITFERLWGQGGPAASARSGDMAVVRTAGSVSGGAVSSGTVDAFAESDYSSQTPSLPLPNELAHYWGSGSSFGAELESPAEVLQAEGVTSSTAPVVVSRSPNNVDAFWTDANGALDTVYQAAPDWSWHVQSLVPLACNQIGGLEKTIVPPNAAITATARTPGNLDVFFIGSDGNVYDAYWNAGMVDAQGEPKWATAAATTQVCAQGSGCAGSGLPGGSVAALALDPNELDVFYVGADKGLWWSSFSDGSVDPDGTQAAHPWTTREIFAPGGGAQGASLPAGVHLTAAAPTSREMDVFWVGSDGGLWTSSWQADTGAWTAPEEAGGSQGLGNPGGLVSVVARQPDTLDVLFAGAHGELEWSSGQGNENITPKPWTFQTSTILGPGSVGSGGVSIVAPTSYSLQAFYLDGARRVNTRTWNAFSNQWTAPSAIQAPPAPAGLAWTNDACSSSTGTTGGNTGGGAGFPEPGSPGGPLPHPIHFM